MAKEKKTKKVGEDKAKKVEKTPAKKETKKETKKAVAGRVNDHAITTTVLAEKLGTTPKNLRNFLRTHFSHLRQEGYTTWGWDKWTDPELKEIMNAFKNRETKAPAKAKEEGQKNVGKKSTKKDEPAPAKSKKKVKEEELPVEEKTAKKKKKKKEKK